MMLYRPTLPPRQGYIEIDGQYEPQIGEVQQATDFAIFDVAEQATKENETLTFALFETIEFLTAEIDTLKKRISQLENKEGADV